MKAAKPDFKTFGNVNLRFLVLSIQGPRRAPG